MAIQVSDSFNQLKIERGSKVEYYKYATIKSISPVSDSNNDFSVVINFITDDKDNPLVLKMKDISNQATWLNTGVGVNVAIENISDWMHISAELITSMFRVSTAGLNTLPITTRSCSFANVGANDAEVLGATLKAGETVSFDSGGTGSTLSRSPGNEIDYNCLTSELLIIVVSE